MSGPRVAVVSGANKGIGFAIVRALCNKFDADVFLTARDEGRGQAAVQQLKQEGLDPKFHQLDITDHQSIVRLRDFLQKTYGGLDVLVNNAAIAYKPYSDAPYAEEARETIRINFLCTLDVCEVLFPILRPHARVATMSSMFASRALARLPNDVKAKLVNPSVTMEEVKQVMDDFVQAAEAGKFQRAGNEHHAYCMSKLAVLVMTVIQQRELDRQGAEDVVVNTCCPGWVDTDLNDHSGPLTPDQGAENPVHLVLLPPNVESPRGDYFAEMKVQTWR